jgi:hypothetical protein
MSHARFDSNLIPILSFSVAVIAISSCLKDRAGELTVAGLETAHHDAVWDATSALRGDIDCDGAADLAALGREPGKILVGVVRGSGQPPQLLSFGISANQQDAICSEPARLAFESQADPDESLEGYRPSATCQGLRLSGGECDAVHVYWNHTASGLGSWRH